MKYLKVVDGLKSSAGNFQYKIDEINIASNWNPNADNPKEMGGFSFSNEENILRWLIKGTIIYDVIIPNNTEVVKINHPATPNGVFRSNKIILTNPRKITDEFALELYYKSNFPEKTYYKALAGVAIKGLIKTANKIIEDKINKDNVDEAISEYKGFYYPSPEAKKQEYENYYKYLNILSKIKDNQPIT